MRDNSITDETVDSYKYLWIISINDDRIDPESGYIVSDSYFMRDHDRVISVSFPDIDKPIFDGKRMYYPITEEQAAKIVRFLDKLHCEDKFQLIIHCTAGISRSGAVGEFACEYLGCDKREFLRKHPNILPNSTVLRILRRVSIALSSN
jgi:predicted protein tyrosine phosphatase